MSYLLCSNDCCFVCYFYIFSYRKFMLYFSFVCSYILYINVVITKHKCCSVGCVIYDSMFCVSIINTVCESWCLYFILFYIFVMHIRFISLLDILYFLISNFGVIDSLCMYTLLNNDVVGDLSCLVLFFVCFRRQNSLVVYFFMLISR